MKKVTKIVLFMFLLSLLTTIAYAGVGVTVDGDAVALNTPPIIANSRTLVPVRDIFQAVGADVNWDSNTKTITGKKNGTILQMYLNSTRLTIDGLDTTMDSEPVLIDGRTYAPARYVAEGFGYTVGWNNARGIVEITSSDKKTDVEPADDSRLKVNFIDVGQGDSALIECDGKYMLVDAGEVDQSKTVVNYLNSKGVKTLDYAIATHPHSDHIGGMTAVLNNFDVKHIILPNVAQTTQTYISMLTAIKNNNIDAIQPVVGESYSLGSSKFTIVGPSKIVNDELNNDSIAFRLTFKNNSFIFCGDAEKEEEADMLATGQSLSADVYKVSHHGSSSSSTASFLKAVQPEIAVISVGKDNSYGHPTKTTLNALANVGATVYRTDLKGTIIITSDGNKLSTEFIATPSTSQSVNKNTENNNVSGEGSSSNNQSGTQIVNSNQSNSYVLNTSSKKIHKPECSSVSKMSDKNKESYTGSLADLKAKGYTPCKICNPQ